ncbi:50S ribosomal protein L24 [Aureibacter tunicatorum]|uniref:Large ribosomal subunit protein uL24 n=1 Tax=Aureibacter tunicatorum TaxID=866807 RepID=A0AAE4BS46_9BACT|nr:50S ribosomal protein L24 [Aureibacter tunicatorum]MDR6237972.1 large subunit ribosomal protein L24 [Aureibacter tunicatorum]BDD03005.1 50S ribosomal protein L24 [Aureibacter tunicatorum]
MATKSVKLRLKKGDTVKIIAGNDKGKTGVVQQVLTSESRVIVEGVRVVTKHIKPSATNPQGGIEKVEAPIHVSNVMLIDPAKGEPTKVGRKLDANGKLVRFSKKTGEIIQ